MKFLIIGSMYQLENKGQNEFQKACEELGSGLAESGQILHLCSAHPQVADPFVVAGATRTKGCEIVFFRANPEIYKKHPEADVEHFKVRLSNSGANATWVECDGDWSVVHKQALSKSDAVLVIGGGVHGGTMQVIDSAKAIGKPLVLLPEFGGAALRTWQDVEPFYLEDELKALQESSSSAEWGAHIAKVAIGIAKRAGHFWDVRG